MIHYLLHGSRKTDPINSGIIQFCENARESSSWKFHNVNEYCISKEAKSDYGTDLAWFELASWDFQTEAETLSDELPSQLGVVCVLKILVIT